VKNIYYPLRIFIVIILAFSAQSLSAQHDDVHPDPMAEAAAAMRKREFTRAEQIYRGLLRQNPDDVNVQHLLAHSLMYQNRFEETDVMLKKMLMADTGLAGTYWYMGLSAERQQKDSFATVCFLKYIQKTPRTDIQNVSAWLHAASGYRRMMHKQGITYVQSEHMIFLYQQYLQVAPTEPHADEIRYFIEQVKMRRPKGNGIFVWTEED
jgi:hypothetical protein